MSLSLHVYILPIKKHINFHKYQYFTILNTNIIYCKDLKPCNSLALEKAMKQEGNLFALDSSPF